MSQNRSQIDGGANNVRQQQAGECVMSQLRLVAVATAGAGSLTGAQVASGGINRTGPAGAFTDTLPDAAAILAANPVLSVGDSFELLYRNTVAQAGTIAAGQGIVLGTNTDVAASTVRKYLFTVLGTGTPQILQIRTTNATASLTGLSPEQAAQLSPGMGVTGTGIPANTTIIGVNSTTGVITLSATATATGTVAGTFFPRIQVQGLFSATL